MHSCTAISWRKYICISRLDSSHPEWAKFATFTNPSTVSVKPPVIGTPNSLWNWLVMALFNLALIILIYIDDIILASNKTTATESFEQYQAQQLRLEDLGPLWYFLGIEVACTTQKLFLSQRKYAPDILSKTGMLGCKTIFLSCGTTASSPRWFWCPLPSTEVIPPPCGLAYLFNYYTIEIVLFSACFVIIFASSSTTALGCHHMGPLVY